MQANSNSAAMPLQWGGPRPTVEQLRTLPERLRRVPAWVVWRLEPSGNGGKPRKVPHYVNGHRRHGTEGGPEDRAALAPFDAALDTYGRGGFDGIGLAMLPEHGLVALDLDACVMDGEIDPRAACMALGTYAEFSPSGTGIRAFYVGALADLKDNAPRDGGCRAEFFHAKGYVTVTGNVTPDCFTFGCEGEVAPLPDTVAADHVARMVRGVGGVSGSLTFDGDDGEDLARVHALATVTDQTLADLTSAVAFLAEHGVGDEYDDWQSVGQALKSLGDRGLALWMEYSSECDKFNERDARRKWARDLKGERTDYRALFTKAQSLGWVNPAKGRKASAANFEDLTDKTDTGNANLLLRLTGGDLRFVSERGTFIVWTGQGWNPDHDGALAHARALLVSKHYFAKAEDFERQGADPALDPAEQKRFAKLATSAREWAGQCRNKGRLDAMLALLARDARAIVHADELDRHPHLLGVANGVVDLRTGELRPAARDDYVTKRTRFAYRPEARAPRWHRFINEATGAPVPAAMDGQGHVIPETVGRYKPRTDYAGYLQRAAGYWATGEDREHKLFIATGKGANGKSVILDTLQEVYGDYATVLAPEAISASRHDSDAERPSSAIAALAGRRFGVSSESRDGQRLDGALVKRHTGGGYMTARFMRENVFRFRITHKLILMTNHRPALDLLDDATRGRLHMLPFDRTWNRPGKPDRDPTLPDGERDLMQVLAGEGEGVLAWVIEGAAAYYRDGLDPPTEVIGATVDFFQHADALGRWLETCDRCPPREGIRTSDAFDRFRGWCRSEGVPAGVAGVKAFSMEVQRRGVTHAKLESGAYLGIKTGALF